MYIYIYILIVDMSVPPGPQQSRAAILIPIHASLSLSIYIYIYIHIYIYIPLPKKVLQTSYCSYLFQGNALQTLLGMGMGMNVTAQQISFQRLDFTEKKGTAQKTQPLESLGRERVSRKIGCSFET